MGDEGAIRQIIGGAIEHEDPASLLTNERNHSCRRFGHAASPDYVGAEQTTHASLRQADDLLSAFRAHARRNP